MFENFFLFVSHKFDWHIYRYSKEFYCANKCKRENDSFFCLGNLVLAATDLTVPPRTNRVRFHLTVMKKTNIPSGKNFNIFFAPPEKN